MSTTSRPVPAPGVRGPAGSGRAALQDLPVLTWLPVAAMGALGVLALAGSTVIGRRTMRQRKNA